MAAIPVESLPAAQKQELLCTYAALILHDDDLDITEENINKLVKAAGTSVESYMPMLFSRALQGKDVNSVLTSAGSPGAGGGGAAAGGGGGDSGAKAAVEEAKKEESEEEEEEEDMGFSLFD